MNEAKAIRKHAAQHDLFNRVHSIAADERFVRKVADDWYKNRFEVIGTPRLSHIELTLHSQPTLWILVL
jgi:tRNA A64-2'-O-ribosylphosphate transferase